MQESPRKVTHHFFLVVPIILITSYLVWNINVEILQHNRNFYRSLNFHILEHDIIDVYWFGQGMNNFPINEYMRISDLQDFFKRMHNKMSNLQMLTYGQVDQDKLNRTQQSIQMHLRNGDTATYAFTLQDGPLPGEPFTFEDLQQMKAVLNTVEAINFNFQNIDIGRGYIWDIIVKVEPFSATSVFVHLISHQKLSLAKQHILPFISGVILGLLVLYEYYKKPERRMDNILYYFLSVFLVTTSILAFSEQIPFETVYMLDGITCCSAWICTIKFYLKDNDYNLSFLLGQCYAMIGRLFASFGPLLIAFALFAYVIFSRYSAQFSSFWRTFLSLFYICYYNMTYESTIVTGRSNPISMIFFMTFVTVFTICIYSGMLVSVFCSYVWRKRQLIIRQDIEDNLRIQCSACDHKYKYADCVKLRPKKSFNLSEYLRIDFDNPDAKEKYIRIMKARIERLRNSIDQLVDQSANLTQKLDLSIECCNQLREDLWREYKTIKNLLGES